MNKIWANTDFVKPEPHGLFLEVGKYRPATTIKAPLYPILTEDLHIQRKEHYQKTGPSKKEVHNLDRRVKIKYNKIPIESYKPQS